MCLSVPFLSTPQRFTSTGYCKNLPKDKVSGRTATVCHQHPIDNSLLNLHPEMVSCQIAPTWGSELKGTRWQMTRFSFALVIKYFQALVSFLPGRQTILSTLAKSGPTADLTNLKICHIFKGRRSGWMALLSYKVIEQWDCRILKGWLIGWRNSDNLKKMLLKVGFCVLEIGQHKGPARSFRAFQNLFKASPSFMTAGVYLRTYTSRKSMNAFHCHDNNSNRI